MPIVFYINDYYCPYPEEYLDQARCYVEKKPYGKRHHFEEWWRAKQNSESAKEEFLVYLFERVFLHHLPGFIIPLSFIPEESIRNNPGLKTINQLSLAQELLAMGIAIHPEAITREVDRILEQNSSPNELFLQETLLAALSKPILVLQLHVDYLEKLLEELPPESNSKSPFERIGDRIFIESGVSIPAFELKVDYELPYGAFRLMLNDCKVIEAFGLPPGSGLYSIAEAYSIEDMGLSPNDVLEVNHPLTGQILYQILDLDKEQTLQRNYFYLLQRINALEYLALCCKAALDQRLYCLVNMNLIDNYLSNLKRRISPTYIEAVLHQLPLPLLACTLRILVKEGFSLRHFQQILELLLEADYIPLDSEEYLTSIDRRVPTQASSATLPQVQTPIFLAQYVRKNLSNYIVAQKLPLKKVDVAIKVERDIVNLLKTTNEFSPELHAQILQQIEQKLAWLSASNPNSIVFHTYGHLRSRFAALSRLGFPNIPVMVTEELQQVKVVGKDSLSFQQ